MGIKILTLLLAGTVAVVVWMGVTGQLGSRVPPVVQDDLEHLVELWNAGNAAGFARHLNAHHFPGGMDSIAGMVHQFRGFMGEVRNTGSPTFRSKSERDYAAYEVRTAMKAENGNVNLRLDYDEMFQIVSFDVRFSGSCD